jgi:hypothetical protein
MLWQWLTNSISASAVFGEQSNEASFCHQLESVDAQGGFPQTLRALNEILSKGEKQKCKERFEDD